MKVQFIVSPSGQPFNLAYFAGDIADIDDKTAKKLIEANIAREYSANDSGSTEKVEKATSKPASKAEQR